MTTRESTILLYTDKDGHRGAVQDNHKLLLYALKGVERLADPCWGYPSPGTLILARSILFAILGDLDAAVALAGEYAHEVLCGLGGPQHFIHGSEVLTWVQDDPGRAVWLGRN